MMGLINFTLSKAAKMEVQQFTELQRKWTQVMEDLIYVKYIQCLSSPIVIEVVLKNLSGHESQMHHECLRRTQVQEGKTEMEVLQEFMVKEQEIQRYRIGAVSPDKSEDKSKYYYCGDSGHKKDKCPKGARGEKKTWTVNATTKIQPVHCPSCNKHHLYQERGETFYSTEFTVCDNLKSECVAD